VPAFLNLRAHLVRRAAPARRAAILVVALCSAVPASGTTANDLCAASADPCTVTRLINVDDGSIIDLGARALRVLGRLDVGSGSMTLNAGRIDVLVDGELRARGDATLAGGVITATAGSIQIDGRIDASGSPGGAVDLTSRGDLNVNGSIDADSLTNDELGGDVRLSGGGVNVTGPVTAQGGRERFGGDIEIRASEALSVTDELNATGGAGGSVDLTAGTGPAGGRLLIAGTSQILADASGSGEDGGLIDFTTSSAGGIEVRGVVSAVGRGSSEGAGDGGAITVDAAEEFILSAAASMTANGGSPDGTGGSADFTSGGAMLLAGRVELRGLGGEADAGELLVDVEGTADLNGLIDLRAGGGTGGSMDLDAEGDTLSVGQGARIDASTSGSGSGGSITLTAEARLVVRGELTTDGGSSAGASAGIIDLDGCQVEIAEDGILRSDRAEGLNVITGRDETVIAGTLHADPSTGRNELRYPGPGQQPVILGSADIAPSAVLNEDPGVQPCQERTPSPTRTPTPTRTPGGSTSTPTGTRTPGLGACLGDCDGDEIVSIDELVRAVMAALAQPPLSACGGLDRNDNDAIEIDELVAAVAAALGGCG
jgi:hypothetical protein